MSVKIYPPGEFWKQELWISGLFFYEKVIFSCQVQRLPLKRGGGNSRTAWLHHVTAQWLPVGLYDRERAWNVWLWWYYEPIFENY
ncbi:MAG: hypothetical protein K6U74_19060 [Firmicutes bacterium]|nr:hypothetical protein [Bacillota bacterium]